MQPTFIPWLGYFELIYSSDIFVFYDTAQYQKSSWHNRNKVLNKNNEIWLSIPVKRRNLKQSLSDSKFDETKKKWRLKFSQTFVQAYSRHDHFHEMSWLASEICSSEQQSLSEFNIDLIQKICKAMGIEKKFFRSSDMDLSGERSEKLIKICNFVGATAYRTPIGALDYLTLDEFEKKSGLELIVQKFEAVPYPQRGASRFHSHLSIVDPICNIGAVKTLNFLTSK